MIPLATPNESTLEEACLDWFRDLGYAVAHGPDLAPGEARAERSSYGDVILEGRLREALWRLNVGLPPEAIEEAIRKLMLVESPSLIALNRRFHNLLVSGVEVEVRRQDGSTGGERVRLVDFDDPAANDLLALNQFTVIEDGHNRRMDVVVFVNGLPLAVLELKHPGDENADIWKAFNQLQTYKAEIPSLFRFNELLVISDGMNARMGSLTASREWFKQWRTVDGGSVAPSSALELETLVEGVFHPSRLFRLIEGFVAFEEDKDGDQIHKLLAGYHQFHAVETALRETLRASGMGVEENQVREGTFWSGDMAGGERGDRRAGVVWHTQGSGKSLSMLFYAGRAIRHPAMRNPTIVVLTDRNDLDDQLFGQFLRCHDLLRQKPLQADNRAQLRELLQVASGGVIFTTLQKYLPEEKGDRMPCLTDRENVVVIADEAHRSQYGLIAGFARNLRDALPNASFIGFTGTPIEKADANTRAVFGDYVSIYDIERAVEDGSTVPIYYESRIAKLSLNEQALGSLDDEFDAITEDEESRDREKLKSKWAALEALVGEEKRIQLIASDLVAHFVRRRDAMEGKAMVVCMSRRICVEMYNALIALRPDWAGDVRDNAEAEASRDCVVKIVMTGSASDPEGWQQHVRSKQQRKELAKRFKSPKDPFRIVLVRDMWLTGFDAPCLHTLYVDKPMQGHGLMQAIARVNRVFRDKPGGLIVDYLGLADQLKKALATYTESGGRGQPTYDTADAVAAMLEKFEVCCAMLHPVNWREVWHGGSSMERMRLMPEALDHILEQENGKARFTQTVTDLSRAFALCATRPEAEEKRDDIAFFQQLRAALMKRRISERSPEDIEAAIRQLVSSAIVPGEEVIDVFTAAGLPRPDISILSDSFLAEVQGLKHRNVAAELLQKLLKDEVQTIRKRNVVQGERFSEKLEKALKAYHNRAISSQEIIEELIQLAKEMREANQRGEGMGLNPDEIAFYDALANNESAVRAMGNDELKVIAAELVTKVRQSVTIDWTVREAARAKIRVMVRRILNKHGYPPDLQEDAVKTVLRQAEALCVGWGANE
jgi:type I restriction enzyme R subunit